MRIQIRMITVMMIMCYYSCDYSREVKKESAKIFSIHKNFMIELGFTGVVYEKKICENCKFNKYTLKIGLTQLNKKPEFKDTYYPPYYHFENDSVLNISVDANLFSAVELKDKIVKEAKSFTFIVNQVEIQYLNKKEMKWLPTTD